MKLFNVVWSICSPALFTKSMIQIDNYLQLESIIQCCWLCTMEPCLLFSLQSLQHFEKCQESASLPKDADIHQCCSGVLSCWSASLAAECCKAIRNKAGDDPTVAFLTAGL